MRAFHCADSTLRRRTGLAVILLSIFVTEVSAQQAVSGVSLPLTARANTSDPYEQNQLGIASALVLGPGRTIQDARKWFEKSAQQGYVPAQVNLGVLYAYGWGTSQNYGAALYWLKAAANQGSARAETNLGILYLKGLGVKQDYSEALRYFQSAAGAGDAGAMVNLGS